MGLILCPECGTKISDRATACPHCGFQSVDVTKPICEQDQYEMVPVFEYDIVDGNSSDENLRVISYEDNRRLVNHFGKWENIKIELPAIAEVIESLANKEHVMVAKMDDYVKDLIDKGIYKFTIDKQGEILPTIRDAKGIVKQVRLEDMALAPNLVQSLNNLSVHAVMTQILDEIKYVEMSIRDLHVEMQNDRLAKIEGSRDQLKQAQKIRDTRLRELALLGAINNATEAKNILMRNFSQNRNYVMKNSGKNYMHLMQNTKEKKEISVKADDATQSLVYITNAVQTECMGFAMLGEYEPCRECLDEFKKFIVDNKLDDRDTLLTLNENLAQEQKNVVDGFSDIAGRITTFNESDGMLEYHLKYLLTYNGDDENGKA